MRNRMLVLAGTLALSSGTPVSAQQAAVAAKTAVLNVDATNLQPMTLVYELVADGARVAENTLTVGREMRKGRDVVVARSTTAGLTNGSNELVFDARSFAAISMSMELLIGPQALGMHLRSDGNRITGVMRGPQGESPIDAAVPTGTLLAGMDLFALMLTDFTRTRELTFSLFDAQSGNVSDVTAKLMGESRVTVPAGAFDVYDLSVSGADGVRAIAVTRTAPHVIVRQELTSHAVVMELKSQK